ncbi:MAG TPA: tRNA dihydrouridine synthase DusB [Acidobacteriota bacterium]|nr:tRNA dihydrouridine synthase DusB [Acidobacteriota bacterium]HQQ47551.1 tRNA dihydrouridine synthase DusB [Acidobacteriota bacterium]
MKALHVGNRLIDPPLIFAPMAGLSEAVLRKTVYSLGSLGLTVTELVPIEGLLRGRLKLSEYLSKDDLEFTSLQLSGSTPERFLEAGRMAVDYGARMIDVNMGCPVPKITKSGGGSALLREPVKARRVVEILSANLPVPVTAKIRSGWDEGSVNFADVGKALEDGGAAAITLHSRTRKAMYTGKADWKQIALLKKSVSVPVIGNGDITRPQEAKRMFDETGCDAVMIGRGAVRNPFIFKQTTEFLETGSYGEPGMEERLAFMKRHFEDLISSLEAGKALHYMKLFVGKFTRGMDHAASLRQSLSVVKTPFELLSLFNEWAEEQN